MPNKEYVTLNVYKEILTNVRRLKNEFTEDEDEFYTFSATLKKILVDSNNWKEPKSKKIKITKKRVGSLR